MGSSIEAPSPVPLHVTTSHPGILSHLVSFFAPAASPLVAATSSALSSLTRLIARGPNKWNLQGSVRLWFGANVAASTARSIDASQLSGRSTAKSLIVRRVRSASCRPILAVSSLALVCSSQNEPTYIQASSSPLVERPRIGALPASVASTVVHRRRLLAPLSSHRFLRAARVADSALMMLGILVASGATQRDRIDHCCSSVSTSIKVDRPSPAVANTLVSELPPVPASLPAAKTNASNCSLHRARRKTSSPSAVRTTLSFLGPSGTVCSTF
mmetsp:Transcript_33305/g.87660  ORF Transcript_33305/g.87660 Transcript_33305/m.87660 type:complete len:272 (+) Transcript_33305:450-1265(+)